MKFSKCYVCCLCGHRTENPAKHHLDSAVPCRSMAFRWEPITVEPVTEQHMRKRLPIKPYGIPLGSMAHQLRSILK